MTTDNKSIARREFLTVVGKVAGSAAMLRTMAAMGIGLSAAACGSSSAAPGAPVVPPPPPPRLQSPRPGDWPANVGVGKTVVILGAGIAGMTAAIEMKKLGYTCTVLEATSVGGGRNRTIRGGDTVSETDSSQLCTFDADPDLYFNPGPARISHHHEFLLGYCRQFGIALETFVNENHAALMHSATSFGGQPQIRRRVLTDTRGNIARLLAKAVNQNALDQDLSPTDKSNILAALQEFGDLDSAFNYTGSERGGFPGQEDTGSRQRGERVTPLQLQQLIGDIFFQQRQDFTQGLEQQPTMLQPVGGMDRISRAFEAQVAADTLYESVVSEIRKIANGVRVVYSDRFGSVFNLDADYCICTIPATVLRSIANDFSAAHQSAVSSFAYSSAGKIAFQSRRFWEQNHNIYGGISWTTQDITQIWYPNNGFGRNDGVLVGAYMFGGNAGNQFAAQSPQQRINSSVNQGGNLHAEYSAEVGRGISVAWPKVPFQLGAWGVSDPGILLSPDANIYFAGEHLSLLQGWQEGAILSAYHAIDGIVARDIA
ncbi:MAG: FAD-dependent oxidoreductase [Gammaproteobacteria bacterium]|nr:FAD-dependent oxidoreductase [Gammaproteobacteria bacterium]MDH5212741.1 FAD-dependent oxidoreductase [Gammaproteobacteria bacterium]